MKKPETNKIQSRLDNIVQNKNDHSVVEAYRTIRTNFIFAVSKKEKCNVVLFSSPLPRDGKSTTCVNLGVSLAQIGVKVLIIDCDMRKPRVHRFFKITNTPGLSNFLAGFNNLAEVLKKTEHENVSIIPSGIIPPNPAELLSGPAMTNLLSELETHFDYILIDAPPVNIVSDALLLSKICDGVILIVRQGVTPHPALAKSIKSLEMIDADILGLVLNEVNYDYGYMKYKYGKYYNRYGYSYRYGYGNDKK